MSSHRPGPNSSLPTPDSIDDYLGSHAGLQVDILVSNAGINILNAVPDIDLAAFEEMQRINVMAALRLIQAFAPGMAQRGWGRILTMSSILGLKARKRRAAYSMTKAALEALTRTVAVEFGPMGVLANSLAPGYVDTELTRQNNPPEVVAAITAGVPLRRLAQPEELAKVAGFLRVRREHLPDWTDHRGRRRARMQVTCSTFTIRSGAGDYCGRGVRFARRSDPVRRRRQPVRVPRR